MRNFLPHLVVLLFHYHYISKKRARIVVVRGSQPQYRQITVGIVYASNINIIIYI